MNPILTAISMEQRPPRRRRGRTASLAALAAAMLALAGCGILRGHQSPSAYVDDSALTARVKTALIKDPVVKASEIDVNTYQGRVTLSGVVDNEKMVQRAEQIARDTPGVKSVRSTMEVANAGSGASSRR